MTETCAKYVADRVFSGGSTCGRPVKADGLCGLHLAGKRRREANDAKRRGERTAGQERLTEAQDACARLAARGIEARPEYASYPASGHTGRVSIAAADVLALLDGHVR